MLSLLVRHLTISVATSLLVLSSPLSPLLIRYLAISALILFLFGFLQIATYPVNYALLVCCLLSLSDSLHIASSILCFFHLLVTRCQLKCFSYPYCVTQAHRTKDFLKTRNWYFHSLHQLESFQSVGSHFLDVKMPSLCLSELAHLSTQHGKSAVIEVNWNTVWQPSDFPAAWLFYSVVCFRII